MSAGAAAGAAAAAAAALMRQEEEEMTGYTNDDLGGEWEFKILRSNYATFGKAERLREVLEEEAQSGWVLLEKFDDQRIRLKRPVSARALDAKRAIDPYRTTVNGDAGRVLAVVLAILGGFLAVPLLFAATVGGVKGAAIAVPILAGLVPAIVLAVRHISSQSARRHDAPKFDDF